MVTSRAKPKRWVGLDLGSHSLKLAELERTPAGVRLIRSLIQELPLAEGGAPIDRVGWLQSALTEFNADEVHVSIGGPHVALRRVSMPLMSRRELPEAVKWQIKDQVPFPVQDAVVDARVIGEVWEKDIKKQDVLAAAAARVVVQELIAVVERAGGRCASIVPTQAAMWQCVLALVPDARQGSVAVIEIGAQETEIAIAKDGHIRVVRDLAVGSVSVTEALIGTVSSETGDKTIDRARAEEIKRRYGVVSDAAEGTTEDGVPLFHISSLMRPVLEHLLTEVSRVFDFYKVQMEEAGVSRVLLCGAGANLKQLQSFLSEGLGMTVETFNPLLRIPDRAQPPEPEQVSEQGPRLGVAIGLALDHGQGLTLLPVEVARHRMAASSRRLWMTAAKGLAAAALVVYLGLHAVSGALQWQIRGLERAWADVRPAYVHCMETVSACKMLEGVLDDTQRFNDAQPVWDGLFKEIGELIPASIELQELMVASDERGPERPMTFTLKGRAVSGLGAGEGGVARFMEALERSVFFDELALVTSETDPGESGGTAFEIRGVLE